MSWAVSNTTPWATEQDQILRDLDVEPSEGLPLQEAAARLERFGPNILSEFRRVSWLTILWRQLRSFIMLLLAAGAALSFALGDHLEGVAIVAVIVLNTMIGFVTELRAVRSTEALRELGSTETTVRRDGVVRRLPAQELVPGDVVLLEGGDVITADIRILNASGVETDESMLTGESTPVEKGMETLAADTPVADRRNMLFKGTSLAKGTAEGIVVSTGMNTELGRITTLVQAAPDRRTPLEERIDALGRVMGWLCIGLVTVIAILGAVGGKDTTEIIKTAIALAVATVPEGLPIVATLALARGVLRMARRNALVEQLSAVETLGSTTVILTDKTGTLTENRMAVTEVVVPGHDLQPLRCAISRPTEEDEIVESVRALLTAAALCSDATIGRDEAGREVRVGDPMELALLVALDRIGIDHEQALVEQPRLSEEAFDPDTKMMASVHRYRGRTRIIVKGAPEAVFAVSRFIRGPSEAAASDPNEFRTWQAENLRMAAKGLRMLAVAERATEPASEPYRDLTLLGLVALSDPPRADVVDSIEQCHAAGIEVVMVTGDQGPTAEHIAASLKLIDDQQRGGAVSGAELESLLDGREAGRRKLLGTRVFARTDPEQKLRLLSFYQAQGEVVAMIGDGVNDAPALRRSDIGVAMGQRGTQVAREAADMILQDDQFSTIVVAIEQGRIIFRNIRSFVFYLLSCNLSEIITVGLAAAVNAPLPILPMQILFLNLVTDVFPALALGVGDTDPGIMRHPPRPKGEPLLASRHWAGLLSYGLVMSAAVLGGFAIALLVFEMETRRAVTVSFLILAGAQLGHVFNMASPKSRLFVNEVTRNPWIWGAVVLCIGLLIGAVYIPTLSDALGTQEPGKEGWLLVLTLSFAPTVVGLVFRAARQLARRRGKRR